MLKDLELELKQKVLPIQFTEVAKRVLMVMLELVKQPKLELELRLLVLE